MSKVRFPGASPKLAAAIKRAQRGQLMDFALFDAVACIYQLNRERLKLKPFGTSKANDQLALELATSVGDFQTWS
jgi:hypothetical protein